MLALPEKGTDLAAMNITPVPKTLFLDLLKDVYKNPTIPTQIYAFAVDAKAAGVNYVPQRLPSPLYSPGHGRHHQAPHWK